MKRLIDSLRGLLARTGRAARALSLAGAALAIALPASAGETVTYFHNDPFGTPVMATDAAGNVVWKETYRPYGSKLNNQPASVGNKIGFTGQPFDASTGLSYMGARYYDPVLGRFMGVDPAPPSLDNVHSLNRYAYANNNPYRYVDPDGHSPLDVVFLVWDLTKLGAAVYSGNPAHIAEAGADVIVSMIGVASPVPGTGQALKVARAAERGVEAARLAEKGAEGSKAAKEGALVIGRGKDLAKADALRAGEYKLGWQSKLPNWKAEWKENAGRLRDAMSQGKPIRDASPGDTGGTFLNAERSLLKDRGWTLDSKTNYWNPPNP